MIITCGQCQAKFKVAPEQIKETGSKVRCSNCQYVFTVFRPKRPAETPPPAADDFASPGGGPDDYYASPGNAPGRTGGSLPDDFYAGRAGDHRRSDFSDSEYDEDDYLDDDRPADDSASMRERRDRRRQLYSDLESPADDSGYDDDPLDDVYDDSEIDDHDGIPPLRRNRARVSSLAEEPEAEDYAGYDEDDFEDHGDDFDPEDIRDTLPAAPTRSDLGLGADPVDHGAAETGPKPDPFARLAAGYHANEGKGLGAAAKSKSKLLLGLAVVALLLGAGIFFLTNQPKEALVADGETVGTEEPSPGGNDEPPADEPEGVRSPDDPNGTAHIVFIDGQQGYFYRKNNHAGNILILTGKVRNNYTEPRSFIRLRGHLLALDERTLADRFAYAGNFLSEEDLTVLPMSEILTRLQFKGGQNNINVNVQPGAEIPFMMVFDNVPDGTEQYRIDAVGSDPAQ